jgi:hypothetical protein
MVVSSVVLCGRAWGCDLCAVYSTAQSDVRLGSGLFAGVAEQYRQQGTLQMDGRQVANQ